MYEYKHIELGIYYIGTYTYVYEYIYITVHLCVFVDKHIYVHVLQNKDIHGSSESLDDSGI